MSCECTGQFTNESRCSKCIGGYILHADTCFPNLCGNCEHEFCLYKNDAFRCTCDDPRDPVNLCRCKDVFADTKDCLSCISGYAKVDEKCVPSINRSWIWIMSVVTGVVVALLVGAGVAIYKIR